MERAIAHFAECGVRIEAVMTDNAWTYTRSPRFTRLLTGIARPPVSRRLPLLGRVLLVACLVALAASCSSKSGHGAVTTTSTTDARDSASLAADKAAAKNVLLRLSDFPTGWESQAPDDSSDKESADAQAKAASCLGLPASAFGKSGAGAESDDFIKDDLDAQSLVRIEATEALAKQSLDALSASGARECVRELGQAAAEYGFEKQKGGHDLKLGDVTAGQISLPTFGDQSVGYRITINVSSEGFNVAEYLDVVYLRVGRTIVTGDFQNTF